MSKVIPITEDGKSFGGISVMTTKLGHVSLATQYRCNDNLMERNALNLKTVKERMTYVLQSSAALGYEVRMLLFNLST